MGEALARYSELNEVDVVYNYISFLLDGNELEDEDTGEAVFTSPDFPVNATDEWDDYEDLYGTLETIIEDIISYDPPTDLIKRLVLEMGIEIILEDINSIYFDKNRRDYFIVMY